MTAENFGEVELAQALTSEYIFVACVDLEKDEVVSFFGNGSNTETYGDIVEIGATYSEAYQLFAYRMVSSEDVVPMLQIGAVEHIREMLLTRKAFIKQFLSTDNHYYSIKFLKVNKKEEYPTKVVIALADNDKEIRDEIEVQEKRRRNLAIIEVLASEYDATFYVDLLQNRCINYSLNDRLDKLFFNNISRDDLFTKKLDNYINMFVFPDDREAVSRATSIYNIGSELSDKKSFMLEYRSVSNGTPHYCEMRFVKVGGDETPKEIVWAVADKDKGIRARLQMAEERENRINMLRRLTDNFEGVYYANLETGEYRLYTENNSFADKVTDRIIKGNDIFADAEINIDKVIYIDDREKVRNFFTRENITRGLEKNTSMSLHYRLLIDGQPRWYRLKVVKTKEDGQDCIIAGVFRAVEYESDSTR